MLSLFSLLFKKHKRRLVSLGFLTEGLPSQCRVRSPRYVCRSGDALLSSPSPFWLLASKQGLIDRRVESNLDFAWQSQLRYYWAPQVSRNRLTRQTRIQSVHVRDKPPIPPCPETSLPSITGLYVHCIAYGCLGLLSPVQRKTNLLGRFCAERVVSRFVLRRCEGQRIDRRVLRSTGEGPTWLNYLSHPPWIPSEPVFGSSSRPKLMPSRWLDDVGVGHLCWAAALDFPNVGWACFSPRYRTCSRCAPLGFYVLPSETKFVCQFA